MFCSTWRTFSNLKEVARNSLEVSFFILLRHTIKFYYLPNLQEDTSCFLKDIAGDVFHIDAQTTKSQRAKHQSQVQLPQVPCATQVSPRRVPRILSSTDMSYSRCSITHCSPVTSSSSSASCSHRPFCSFPLCVRCCPRERTSSFLLSFLHAFDPFASLPSPCPLCSLPLLSTIISSFFPFSSPFLGWFLFVKLSC